MERTRLRTSKRGEFGSSASAVGRTGPVIARCPTGYGCGGCRSAKPRESRGSTESPGTHALARRTLGSGARTVLPSRCLPPSGLLPAMVGAPALRWRQRGPHSNRFEGCSARQHRALPSKRPPRARWRLRKAAPAYAIAAIVAGAEQGQRRNLERRAPAETTAPIRCAAHCPASPRTDPPRSELREGTAPGPGAINSSTHDPSPRPPPRRRRRQQREPPSHCGTPALTRTGKHCRVAGDGARKRLDHRLGTDTGRSGRRRTKGRRKAEAEREVTQDRGMEPMQRERRRRSEPRKRRERESAATRRKRTAQPQSQRHAAADRTTQAEAQAVAGKRLPRGDENE